MPLLEFDRPRAVMIFRDLAQLWQDRLPPFNSELFTPPEIFYRPSRITVGSRAHSLYLFFAAFVSRNGKKAHEVIPQAAEIADLQPWLIDPLHPLSLDRSLFGCLGKIIPFANHEKYIVRIDWWQKDCLNRLRECYQGDPRLIFLGVDLTGNWEVDHEALLKPAMEFFGIGRKIANLLLGWFQEVLWTDNQERWAAIRRIPAIATDMWVMRLIYQLGIVTSYSTDMATQISEPISKYICQICYEEDICHTDLIQAMWHLGAIICGRWRPRTADYRSYCHDHCPAFDHCQGVVPANYTASGSRRNRQENYRTTRRLASMRWTDMTVHPPTHYQGVISGLDLAPQQIGKAPRRGAMQTRPKAIQSLGQEALFDPNETTDRT